ncbi:hypothetical protein [Bacillus sp. AK128]
MTLLSLHKYKSQLKISDSTSEAHVLFQHTMDKIIYDFIQLQEQERTSESMLACIYQQTRSSLFFEPSSRLVSLAKLSNHLLQLINLFNQAKLFTLTQPTTFFVKELNRYLTIELELGEWKDQSFVIKKLIWSEGDRELLINLLSVYSQHAYIQQPSEIELVDMNVGEVFRYSVRPYTSAIKNINELLECSNQSSIYGTFYSLTKEKQ